MSHTKKHSNIPVKGATRSPPQLLAAEGSNWNPRYWAQPNWSNTWGGSTPLQAAGTAPNVSTPIAYPLLNMKAFSSRMGDGTGYISRIVFTYVDESTASIGWPQSADMKPANEIHFAVGETVTSAEALTDRYSGAWLNRGYRINTSLGQSVLIYPEENGSQETLKDNDARVGLGDAEWVDVGCGLLLGGVSQKDEAGYMSLLFLKKVSKSTLTDVKYQAKPIGSIDARIYKVQRSQNNTDQPKQMSVSGTLAETTSRTWSIALTVGISSKTEVKADIFKIVSVSRDFQWQVSTSVTSSSTFIDVETYTWNESTSVAPHTTEQATLSYAMGSLVVDYAGTLNMTLDNGSVYTAPIAGTYTQSAIGCYTTAWDSEPINGS